MSGSNGNAFLVATRCSMSLTASDTVSPIEASTAEASALLFTNRIRYVFPGRVARILCILFIENSREIRILTKFIGLRSHSTEDTNGRYNMTTKTKRQQVTFKIPQETNERLQALAIATRRTKTFVLEEAVSAYLNFNEWQIQSIQRGLEDMKAGRVTPIEDVIAEWEAELENCPD